MAQIHKLELQTEVKCSADQLYGLFKNNITHLSKYYPECYKSIQVIQGDGPSVGSVRLWKYILDGTSVVCKERVTMVDDERKSITWSIFEGEVMNFYNTLELKLVSVTPKNDGSSLVKWCVEFEKANDDAPTPTGYITLLEKISKEMHLHM